MTFREQVMSKKELAAYAGISSATVDRGLADCLQPFKFAGRVYYNREQVERHFASVLENQGRCDGRCKEALKPKVEPELKRSFRRKKRKDRSRDWRNFH
jgi:hypothetical protein